MGFVVDLRRWLLVLGAWCSVVAPPRCAAGLRVPALRIAASRMSRLRGPFRERGAPLHESGEAPMLGTLEVVEVTGALPKAEEKKPRGRVARVSADYLGSLGQLSKYSDDGFTLSTPLRYSAGDWWRHVMSMPRSLILKRVRGHLTFNVGWSVVVAAAYARFGLPGALASLKAPFDLSGGILGILLAFRTSQACNRFWHGREIWAKVVNKVRSFGRALLYLDGPSQQILDAYFRWLEAYPNCLKQHLRGERDIAALTMLNDRERDFLDSNDNLPVACTLALSSLLNNVKTSQGTQTAKDLLWWQLEGELLCNLMGAVGEAEAIAGTPVPLSYSRHTSRLASLWTFCMPFVLVTCLPLYAVPPVTGVVSWTLLATEEISHLIEEPFGLHDDRPNMLPLNRYCAVIAEDLANIKESFSDLQDYAAHIGDPDDDETYVPLYTSSPGVGLASDSPPESAHNSHEEGGDGDDKDARPVYDAPLYPGFAPRQVFDSFKAAKEVQDTPLYPGFAPRQGFDSFKAAKEVQAEPAPALELVQGGLIQ